MATTDIFSQAWSRQILKYIANPATTPVTRPTALYLALLTTVPTTDLGTSVSEFTDYSGSNRPTIEFGSPAVNPSNSAQQQIASTNQQQYTISASGTINGIAIVTYASKTTALTTADFQDEDANAVVWFGDLTSAVAVASGNTLTFAIGNVKINLG